MNHLRKMGLAAAAGAVAVTGVLAGVPANSFFIPGTPGKDVHVGLDNDNADNPFVQPPGVAAKQHMDNTDILFGRGNDDLLIGKLGDDVLLGGKGSDILIGGPEGGSTPNSDVLFGEMRFFRRSAIGSIERERAILSSVTSKAKRGCTLPCPRFGPHGGLLVEYRVERKRYVSAKAGNVSSWPE